MCYVETMALAAYEISHLLALGVKRRRRSSMASAARATVTRTNSTPCSKRLNIMTGFSAGAYRESTVMVQGLHRATS